MMSEDLKKLLDRRLPVAIEAPDAVRVLREIASHIDRYGHELGRRAAWDITCDLRRIAEWIDAQ